jgi:hypothetical protein
MQRNKLYNYIIYKIYTKGLVMDVSSSSSTQLATAPGDIQKTAQTVQERQVQQILDSASVQNQQTTAQKTGMGTKLNISA